jgi:hypothetical protein
MRTAGKPPRKQKNAISPIVSVVVIIVAIVVIGSIFYYFFQKPQAGGIGSGVKLTKASVQARLKDLDRWNKEVERAKIEGRVPDQTLRPKAPFQYLNNGQSSGQMRGMPGTPGTGR